METPIVLKTTKIRGCRVCRSSALTPVIDFGLMPLAGSFGHYWSPESMYRAPLALVVCEKCGLLQTRDSIKEPDKIFRGYSYRSSYSPDLRLHFQRLATTLASHYGVYHELCVDVGCNDGILLRPLKRLGAHVLGVDPSDVAKMEAEETDGFSLVNEYLTPEVARRIAGTYGRAKVVTACNVLAHTESLHSLAASIAYLLHEERGVAVIEVHYQGDLVSDRQFDTVYHEHVCYYNLGALNRLLDINGLKIIGIEFINTHAGSVRVFAAHRGSSYRKSEFVDRTIADEPEPDWKTFVEDVERKRQTLTELVEMYRREGRTVAAYGASGRATVLLNYCGLGDNKIAFVVDASPRRQGRVIPGVNVPIVPPEFIDTHSPDVVIVTAWPYEKTIRNLHPNYQGVWVVPLPEVRII